MHDQLELKVVGYCGLSHYVGAVDKQGNIHDARLLISPPRDPRARYFRIPVGSVLPERVHEEVWNVIYTKSTKRPRKQRRGFLERPVNPREWVVGRVLTIYTDMDGYRLCKISWHDFPYTTVEPLHLIEEMAPHKVQSYYTREALRMMDVD
jgi:hypothetical protein